MIIFTFGYLSLCRHFMLIMKHLHTYLSSTNIYPFEAYLSMTDIQSAQMVQINKEVNDRYSVRTNGTKN